MLAQTSPGLQSFSMVDSFVPLLRLSIFLIGQTKNFCKIFPVTPSAYLHPTKNLPPRENLNHYSIPRVASASQIYPGLFRFNPFRVFVNPILNILHKQPILVFYWYKNLLIYEVLIHYELRQARSSTFQQY